MRSKGSGSAAGAPEGRLELVPAKASKQSRRPDTHQIHDGAKREIATEFPRFSKSSAFVSQRSGIARPAVVDIKFEDVEVRLRRLEAAVLGWMKEAA